MRQPWDRGIPLGSQTGESECKHLNGDQVQRLPYHFFSIRTGNRPYPTESDEWVRLKGVSPVGEKWEKLANLFLAGLTSVFRDFERLYVLNAGSLRPVALIQ